MTKIQGFAEDGGKVVVTNGVNSSTFAQKSYPSATITVYLAGTVTLATIYSDRARTAKANPFTAASDGQWFFYIDDVPCDVKFSGGGISAPFTLGDLGAFGVTWQTQIFSGANVGLRIANALAALPTAGGVIDARYDDTTLTITADPFSGITKPFIVLLGAYTYVTDVGMRIGNGNNQMVIGVGNRGTLIQASGAFPGGSLAMIGKTNGAFSCYFKDVYLDCNNTANSIGLDIDGGEEGSGGRDFQVINATLYGVRFTVKAGFAAGSTQNCGIWNFEVNTRGGAGTGVFVDNNVNGVITIGGQQDSTINTNPTIASTGDAIKLTSGGSATYVVQNVHMEEYVNGINKIAVTGPLFAYGILGHSSVTNVINIAAGSIGYVLCNIVQNSATKTLLDSNLTLPGPVVYSVTGNIPFLTDTALVSNTMTVNNQGTFNQGLDVGGNQTFTANQGTIGAYTNTVKPAVIAQNTGARTEALAESVVEVDAINATDAGSALKVRHSGTQVSSRGIDSNVNNWLTYVNYIATETGVNNAIVCAANSGPALTDGLIVTIKLAHSLQAGANTFNYLGGGVRSIVSHYNPANNIGTAYVSGTVIQLRWDNANTVWQDLSQ